jgi:hypothetical protein
MNRSQAHQALLKVSLAVCGVLFVFVFVSILDTRPNRASVGSALVDNVVKRVPAAIPGLMKETHRPHAIGSFQVVKTPCLGRHTQFSELETTSFWIRLAADNCDQKNEISDAHLENKSNGYVATVFTSAPDKITSDFIPLAEGPNFFEMSVKMNSGEQYSYRWTVDRRPTASN